MYLLVCITLKASGDVLKCTYKTVILFTLLQDTQQAVTRTSKQLRRIQNEGTNVEKRLQQAEEDLKIMTKELERERSEHKELNEQVGDRVKFQ